MLSQGNMIENFYYGTKGFCERDINADNRNRVIVINTIIYGKGKDK